MEKIYFYKNNKIYEGITDFVNKHILVILFNHTIPTISEFESGLKFWMKTMILYKQITTTSLLYTGLMKMILIKSKFLMMVRYIPNLKKFQNQNHMCRL